MIVQWVDEGVRAGEIRPDVDRDSIPAVIGALRLVPQHLGLVTAFGNVSHERVLEAMVDIFAAGLARPTGSDSTGHRARPARVARTRGETAPRKAT
jgi:TetR/AcrR family fatty acid metabolism transcriptional regulator